jgi:hypothetical protein
MTSGDINPHDRYVRANLMHPAVAKDYFLNTLPKNILAIVDLNFLDPQPESIIDYKISLRISDVLYKTTFKIDGHNQTGFF